MTLRIVAISLIAAICLGSPAMASTTTDDEQQVRGRGARDRAGSNGESARRGGGDNGGSTAGASRRRDRDDDRGQNRGAGRTAQRRDDDRDRDRGPIIVTRNRPNINVNIGRVSGAPRYYGPAQYDRWARQYYRWSPIGYAPWSLIYGSIGYSTFDLYSGIGAPSPIYGNYGYGAGLPYAPWQASGYDIGGIRLRITPRDAQVFIDGYYAGLVDDFDGTFQSLRLEQGGHRIEVHMPGFEDLELDVHVQPGRTITLHEALRPRP
jgi:hypothetical protein